MKYGDTLRQRSIPAWSHYNIDYNEIKRFIKEHTTPRGSAAAPVSIPGRHPDTSAAAFEATLLAIFDEQHQRIDLFVKSKAGEIRRRLEHARKQLRQLSSPRYAATDRKASVSRLARYARLEADVLKAGEELRSLARFTAAQRTAFRKLLKKYKKWTGSSELEVRVHDDFLDDPKSFTRLDFDAMLDVYSELLLDIRAFYAAKSARAQAELGPFESPRNPGSRPASPIARLSSSVEAGSKVMFDVAFDTTPLGEAGHLAHYFVHPDNVVELQVSLLQHFRYYSTRSGAASATSSRPSTSRAPTTTASATATPLPHAIADYFVIAADRPDRLAKGYASATVDDRERMAGIIPQRAKLCLTWNSEQDPIVSSRSIDGQVTLASFKEKYVPSFFDKTVDFSPRRGSLPDDAIGDLSAIRQDALKDSALQPLYQISSSRTRFVGIDSNEESFVIATLDKDVTMQKLGGEGEPFRFPYAILQVRREGLPSVDPLTTLDRSHLLERVRGFSSHFHALWQICSPRGLAPPFWVPILSRDIRKLPPPAIPHDQSSETQQSPTNSTVGATDSTTAVDTARQSSPDDTWSAPRKKRKLRYAGDVNQAPQTRYWSEYDNPEDEEADGGYVIYVDPYERSTLDYMLDRLRGLFRRGKGIDDQEAAYESAPKDDETSSDEDEHRALLPAFAASSTRGDYGTVPTTAALYEADTGPLTSVLSPGPGLTAPCLLASLAILTVASFLAATSRRKSVREADLAIIFAIVSSLVFGLVGFASLLRRRDVSMTEWAVAVAVIVADAVCAGALLAWMLG